MDVNKFVKQFAEQFEETSVSLFSVSTKFHDLDEWNSLLALSIISMVDEEYDVAINLEELRHVETIGQLYDIVTSKHR